MKLLLATDRPDALPALEETIATAGWQFAGSAVPLEQAGRSVAERRPDALLVSAAGVDRPLLRELHNIRLQTPLPVVLLTPDSTPESVGLAIRAGVNAYAVACTDARRIIHLLEVARARFAELCAMQAELDDVKTRLAERKRIERAKGILMKSRRLEEDAAYRLLRKLAMDRNKRIGEIAEQIIDTANLLL